MRFPIYFLFFMSGIFYLTGNPFYNSIIDADKAVANGKVAQLKYGRRVSASTSAEKPDVTPAKTASPTIQPVVEAKVQKMDEPTSAVASVQEPSLVPSSSLAEPAASDLFDEPKITRLRDGERKTLDWTVFGNKPKEASLTIPVNARSQDEIDADAVKAKKKSSARLLKSASSAKTIKVAKAKRRKLKARKAAKKAKKNKRLARLKRKKNKNALRITRKAKKKTVRKSGKKFGFSGIAGSGGQLTGG